MKGKIIKIAGFLLVVFFVLGCSTEKNTLITRTFHNTTAKYNIFFNGNESFKEGVKKLENSHKDNYSNILPVFTDGNVKTANVALSSMNRSIEKASKVIRKHSITVKPKRRRDGLLERDKEFYDKNEYCKWVDDSYLMMGKSHFYKRDFFPAIQTFEYIIKEYNDELTKYKAFCWLTRTHIELERFEQAQKLIDQLEGDYNFPDELDLMLAEIHADHLLKQEKYDLATEHLENAIKLSREKPKRARYSYILGQLYQRLGKNEEAAFYYKNVIKLNPPYEMAFNAKINSALLYNAESGDSKELVKALSKMLRDDKNIEYQDQIYYALANIYYEENDVTGAIENYILSTQTSTTNTNQKALSFLAIADIYFGDKNYTEAQIYYDSTITFLDTEYSDYNTIYRKATNLTELVKYLTIIYKQDSLQKVAQMPEEKRNELIDYLIEKVKEEEAKQKEADEVNRMQQQLYGNQRYDNRNTQTAGGKWYFYNPNALSMGSSEFVRKWGRRKLEDNWRRKNKATISFEEIADETTEGVDSTGAKLSNKTREYYMVNLPLTDSLMAASHEKIAYALFNVGKVYKEKLQDFPKAIEAFEDLNKKYPNNENTLDSYYKLYQLHKLMNQEQQAQRYKILIVGNYPDSKYAMSLTNPNYFRELEEKERVVKDLYARTYQNFKDRKFDFVIENYYYADTAYKENELIPKFHFLKAMAYGIQADTATLKEELLAVIEEHPSDEVAVSAQEVLRVLDKEKEKLEEEEQKQLDAFEAELLADVDSMIHYVPAKESKHYYIAVVESEKTSANKIMFNISNFNIDYYGVLDFNVSAVVLTADFQLVTVKEFKNKQQALNYYESVINVNEVYEGIDEATFRHFVISVENYKTFYNDKRVGPYLKFFKENYL